MLLVNSVIDIVIWKHFLHYWSFVMIINNSAMDSSNKGPVMQSFDVFCTCVCVPVWKVVYNFPFQNYLLLSLHINYMYCAYLHNNLDAGICHDYTPRTTKLLGVYWFHSVHLSVCPSVCPSVRLSRMPCPLCNIYSSGWILSTLATNDHYHERVCHTQWPLTLT